jgi:hypothetical protein
MRTITPHLWFDKEAKEAAEFYTSIFKGSRIKNTATLYNIACQPASKHAAKTGDPVIASFEPGEDWFHDHEKPGMIKGVELLPPHSHPEDQPSPGPAGRVPANWESLLH